MSDEKKPPGNGSTEHFDDTTPERPHRLLSGQLKDNVQIIYDLVLQDNAINNRLLSIADAWSARGTEVTSLDYKAIAEQLAARGVLNTRAAVDLDPTLNRRAKER